MEDGQPGQSHVGNFCISSPGRTGFAIRTAARRPAPQPPGRSLPWQEPAWSRVPGFRGRLQRLRWRVPIFVTNLPKTSPGKSFGELARILLLLVSAARRLAGEGLTRGAAATQQRRSSHAHLRSTDLDDRSPDDTSGSRPSAGPNGSGPARYAEFTGEREQADLRGGILQLGMEFAYHLAENGSGARPRGHAAAAAYRQLGDRGWKWRYRPPVGSGRCAEAVERRE